MLECPFCNKKIEYVICVSRYYQRQILDDHGKLTEEYEDCNEAIGDTIYTCCPECFNELEFDKNGKLE